MVPLETPSETLKKTSNAIDDKAVPGHITALLKEWQSGDGGALHAVIDGIYPELKKVAAFHLSREARNHTLQPTALVSEIYPRILTIKGKTFPDRRRFFLFVGKLMRHTLIDHAREKVAKKRGGKQKFQDLDDHDIADVHAPGHPDTYLMLDQVLMKLEQVDPKKHEIFEMWFFAGLDPKEIGALLGKSVITIRQHLRSAKCWLGHKIDPETKIPLFPAKPVSQKA